MLRKYGLANDNKYTHNAVSMYDTVYCCINANINAIAGGAGGGGGFQKI